MKKVILLFFLLCFMSCSNETEFADNLNLPCLSNLKMEKF